MRRPCLLLRWGRERAPGPAHARARVCVCEHMWMCRSAVACTIRPLGLKILLLFCARRSLILAPMAGGLPFDECSIQDYRSSHSQHLTGGQLSGKIE